MFHIAAQVLGVCGTSHILPGWLALNELLLRLQLSYAGLDLALFVRILVPSLRPTLTHKFLQKVTVKTWCCS